MKNIPSFEKDHLNMQTGFSVSTTDKDLTTFDLRFKKPNCGRYISAAAIHTTEHILAVILRNSIYKENIVYFGPMGCRTGFYLITRDLAPQTVKQLLKESINLALLYENIPGSTEKECGNYKEHNLFAAKKHLKSYLKILENL